MSALASILAAAGGVPAPSKTAFYVAGGVLVAWAILVSLLGITRPDFPGRGAPARLAMLVTVVVVAGVMSTAVLTS